MRKAWAGRVERICWAKNHRRRPPVGRSFSSDMVEVAAFMSRLNPPTSRPAVLL